MGDAVVGGRGSPRVLAGAPGGRGLQGPVDLPATTAEQVAVEALPEGGRQEVQGERVDARVDELEAEGHDLEVVHEPHGGVACIRIKPHPHLVHVPRQLADDEEKHE